MWREYMEVARSELWALATREKRTWRGREPKRKGGGGGGPTPSPIFSALLEGNGDDCYAGYTCIFILTGQRQVSRCTLSAFLVAGMRTRSAILPAKEVFVLKAVCWMNCPPHGIQSRLFFPRSEQPHLWRCEFQGTVHPETVKTTVPVKLSFYPVQ